MSKLMQKLSFLQKYIHYARYTKSRDTSVIIKRWYKADKGYRKISVIGQDNLLGLSAAACILNMVKLDELCLIDQSSSKSVKGERKDLVDKTGAMSHDVNVSLSSKVDACVDSKIVIVACGKRYTALGKTKNTLVRENIADFEPVVRKIAEVAPDSIILNVTKPVDEMTYLAWQISNFPIERVFGMGLNLRTGQFRYFVSAVAKVEPRLVSGWVIGEYGDASIPIWSSVTINGVPLLTKFPDFRYRNYFDQFASIHKHLLTSSKALFQAKRFDQAWGFGYSVASICDAILNDRYTPFCLSTLVTGQHDITEEVFLSLPCYLNQNGIHGFLNLELNDFEKMELHNNVNEVYEIQKEIKL